MNKLLKLLLWIGGLIVAIPVGLITLGALAAIFGLSDPSPSPPKTAEKKAPVVNIDKSQPNKPEERQTKTILSPLALPVNMTAQDASRWVAENRLVYSQRDAIFVNFEVFNRLSLDDALRLHRLFLMAEQSEDVKPNTDENDRLRRPYYMMHLLVFAGGSAFEPGKRREFAEKSGAVFPTSFFHNITPRGDYINLFDWHKRDQSGSAEIAIREYAKIFGDKDMIAVLEKIGAVEVSKTRTNSNYSSRWRIRVGEKLSQFQPDTLQAIHDAVKKTIGGDRVKLRRDLRALIKSRHTAQTPKKSEE